MISSGQDRYFLRKVSDMKSGNQNQRFFSVSYADTPIGKSSHFHEGHQLLYICHGAADVIVDGCKRTVSDGTLLIFNRLTEHSIKIKSDTYQRYSLRVQPRSEEWQENEYLLFLLFNRTDEFSYQLTDSYEREAMEALFARLTAEYQSTEPFRDEMLRSLFCELIVHVCRRLPWQNYEESSENTKLIHSIRQRFEERYYEDYSLNALEEEYHLSASHLSHLFKRITGKSPMEYLFACRLLAAKRMLATTTLAIGDIVESCGFSDDSNFSRAFRKRVGMSPSDFRKRYRHS